MSLTSVSFDKFGHGFWVLIHDVMHAVLNHLDLDVCAPMSLQSRGDARHEFPKRRVFSGSQHERHADRTVLCSIKFLVRGKSPVYLQHGTQMFGSSVGSGIAGDVGVAERIAIEKIAEVNGFT